ncbi:MAG: hypothetical protein KA957_01870, partial [Syntrophaceae bacterium]|nr:hypothetical protein [Syntrophaceae bacterium]
AEKNRERFLQNCPQDFGDAFQTGREKKRFPAPLWLNRIRNAPGAQDFCGFRFQRRVRTEAECCSFAQDKFVEKKRQGEPTGTHKPPGIKRLYALYKNVPPFAQFSAFHYSMPSPHRSSPGLRERARDHLLPLPARPA